MAGAKAAPEQPVPMKTTAKPVAATPQKQAQQPQAASAAKPATKEAGDKDKPAKSGKSNRRGKGNRGGDREGGEAQPAKVSTATLVCLAWAASRSRWMILNSQVMTTFMICNGVSTCHSIMIFVLSDGCFIVFLVVPLHTHLRKVRMNGT